MVRAAQGGQSAVTQLSGKQSEQQVRSFIAIPVPPEGIQALQEVVRSFDSEFGRHVRWVRPEGIHLTLNFMGNIPASMVVRVLAALPPVTAHFSDFSIGITGLGAFPNIRKPRVLWAGLQGDLEMLSDLQRAVDYAVGDLGVRREQRAFSPHLTLGRVRRDVPEGQLRKIGEIVAAGELPATPSWSASTVNLMRTELDPAGSRHYLVGTATIGGG